ncbi:hypothetical protein H4Q26_010000 [Puccinia striiformis f. sp. tritici PST-130]|nr:hypothetical protein H4Q26_010000 [Puccinia striiformis f. sp. tritici PST-130]
MVLRALFYIFTIVRFKSINQDNRHVYTDPSGSQTPIAPSAGDKVADPNIFFKKGRLEKASLPPIPKGDDGDPDPTLSLDKAHKPQIPIQNAPFSRLLAWDASLPLHRGNVSVVDSRTGSQIYTIMPVPAKRGSFMIADEYGEMVLQARYKVRFLEPIETSELKVQNSTANGQVTFSSDGHRAADFESNQRLDKSQWEADTVGAVQSFSTLKIEETTLGDVEKILTQNNTSHCSTTHRTVGYGQIPDRTMCSLIELHQFLDHICECPHELLSQKCAQQMYLLVDTILLGCPTLANTFPTK